MADQIGFSSELSDLLKVMNGIPHAAKEIFLRELVLNAAKALRQLRLDTLLVENFEYGPRGLHIDIIPDKSNNTLSIVDNGIGMKKADLKELFSVKRKGYRMDSANKLCGKEVGVDSFYKPGCRVFLGFPAVFMVADSVVVTTKHYETDKPCKLSFSASDNYFVVEDVVDSTPTPRGTKVTLQLNKDHFEYLDEDRLKKLIDKYPLDLCHYPISICIPAGKVIGERLADVEEKKRDIHALMKEFEGLKKLFQEELCGRPYLRDVVLSDNYPDIPAVLSLDRGTLYICPRSSMMAKLRSDAELNSEDEEVVARIDLLYMAGLNNVKFYDFKYKTYHMRDRFEELLPNRSYKRPVG